MKTPHDPHSNSKNNLREIYFLLVLGTQLDENRLREHYEVAKVAEGELKLRGGQSPNVEDRLKNRPLADHSLNLNPMPT